MEIRVLRYFLTIAKMENITKAAEALHITQPTLSRQIRELEEEIGTELFFRDSRRIRLTPEGFLLKERAEEILELTDKTIEDLRASSDKVEGMITISTGLIRSTQLLTKIMTEFRKSYPNVRFTLMTATADTIRYQLNRSLIDFGVMLEPVDLTGLSFMRFPVQETWNVIMRSDDPLAGKERICAEDLYDRELILPFRGPLAAELYRWLGKDPDELNIVCYNALGGTAVHIVNNSRAVSLNVDGSLPFLDHTQISAVPLSPPLNGSSAIAWKRDAVHTEPAKRFIDFISCFSGMKDA